MKFSVMPCHWRETCFGSISLCMIMKNEEKVLRRCLASVTGLVDEVVIVDTGSSDRSVSLARELGARVLFDPWQDDFARPRNISIEAARGDWILIMDPDEWLDPADHRRLRMLTRAKNIAAFRLTTRNYSNNPTESGFRHLGKRRDPSGQFAGFVPSVKARLLRASAGLRFEGCWHELVDWQIIREGHAVTTSDIVIHHWAHEIAFDSIRAKSQFYLRLGEKKTREWPDNGQAWWERAVAEAILGLRDRAAYSMTRAISLGFTMPGVHWALARVMNFLGDRDMANFVFEKGICKLYPSLTHIDAHNKTYDRLLKKYNP